MKHKIGNWVIVTRRRLDGPDLEMVGKIVEATPDYAVADCRGTRFTMSDDTAGLVFFRKMTNADWQQRRR